MSRILAFLGGPREARGRLRRRAPYGAGRLRRRPRFARQGLASLGLAELRRWLSSAGTYVFLCSENQGATYTPNGFSYSRRAWRSSSPEVSLAHFCLCQMDLLATKRALHAGNHYVCSAKRSSALERLVLSSESKCQNVRLAQFCLCQMDFLSTRGARLGTISESGRRRKYLFCRTETWPLPGARTPTPLSVAGISALALERRVLSCETESVRGGLSGGGYGGVFDFKKEQSRHTDSRSADFHGCP